MSWLFFLSSRYDKQEARILHLLSKLEKLNGNLISQQLQYLQQRTIWVFQHARKNVALFIRLIPKAAQLTKYLWAVYNHK